PYREFDYFLNTYLGEDGQFLTDFLMDDVNTKLIELNNLEIEISDMVEQHRDIYIEIRTPDDEDPFSDTFQKKWGRLTKGTKKNFEFTKGFERAYVKGGGTQAYTVGKTTLRGKGWGKLKYIKDRLKLNKWVGGAMGAAKMIVGGVGVWAGVTGLMKLWAEGAKGDDLVNITTWATQVALGVCSVVVGVFSIIDGIILIYDTFKDVVSSSMKSAKSFLCKAGYVIAFVMIAIDWAGFLVKLASGDLTGREITYQFVKLSIETGFAVAGIAIGLAIGGTGVGILVGGIIALASLIGGWLNSILNNPSIDVQECYFYFDTETKLSIRRHGSLEVNDHINFHLKVYNDGDRPGWIRAAFRTRQQKIGGWSSGWDGWHEDPYWSNDWRYPPFGKHETFDSYSRFGDFKASIPYPTTNLHYNLQLQYDWQKFELFFLIIPTWWREDGAREDITEPTKMSVLDNRISQFYDDTTELMSTSLLKEEFERAVMDYQWKDAHDTATEIISRTNKNAKTSLEEFLNLEDEDHTQILNDNYYRFHSISQAQFNDIITKYYSEGFRARVLIPDIVWNPFRAYGEAVRNILSYYLSGDI
ncbi:MAG: glycine zipper family protein, partial [Thermoplasmata archaeon]|nr:glycine zipper family protein [Thermoplasmata archaeon]